MTQLSDDQRKLLTEMIGECWNHEWEFIGNQFYGYDKCTKCSAAIFDEPQQRYFDNNEYRRTFDNWPDLGLVKEAIERAGKWGEFFEYANGIWWPQSGTKTTDADRAGWLFTPSRFCILAAEWAESLNEENKFWRK